MTRQIFWGLPPWAVALWYVLALVAVVVFFWGVRGLLAGLRAEVGSDLPPRDEILGRVRRATALTVAQARLRKREPYVGAAHAAIVYGFCTLALGSAILGVDTDITQPLFGWRFFTGAFYRWYSLVLDVMGVVLLLGLMFMMVRRASAPARLEYGTAARRRRYRSEDWVLVISLLYLVVTGFVLEGLRIAITHAPEAGVSPAGWVIAQALGGIGDGPLRAARMTLWWMHGVVALAFVAAIPFTKAGHMIRSFLSTVIEDTMAGKRLPAIVSDSDQPIGYGAVTDISPRHRVQLEACTRCGRCHEVCPANAVGLPLSPRNVILDLQALIQSAERTHTWETPELIGPDQLSSETVWSCMQCNACVEVCPVGIEQAPIVNQLRRRLVEDGDMQPALQKTFETIEKTGNSFGAPRRSRGRWTDRLAFTVKDARREPVDVLWFVGDYASFDPRSQEISVGFARLLTLAGVDFGILYDGEQTAGNDVRRAGEEWLWLDLAEKNSDLLAGCEFNRIVTTDPHSLNTLRHEYDDLGETSVIHHTKLLVELIRDGRLPQPAQLGLTVTYHDPCYLGRHGGEYDDPRELLEQIGCRIIEMPRNRDNSFCCGAGGGRIWMNSPAGIERPSENRIREAATLDGVETFVVACPKDVTMFEDALKTSGSGSSLVLQEVVELTVRAYAAVLDKEIVNVP